MEKILAHLEKKKQQCTVLIDIGIVQFTTSEEQKPLEDLLSLCNLVQTSKVCSVIIAVSSGAEH